LGLALRLYNRVRVSRVVGTDVKIVSQSPVEGRIKATAMLHEAAQLFFKRARVRAFGIEVGLSGDVPVGRGLGASATARLGVVVGLNQLTQAGLNREQLLEIVTELEVIRTMPRRQCSADSRCPGGWLARCGACAFGQSAAEVRDANSTL